MKIAITGASGRMGRMLIEAVLAAPDMELAAALDEPFSGMRVLEVKADRSSLRRLHASIKAAL